MGGLQKQIYPLSICIKQQNPRELCAPARELESDQMEVFSLYLPWGGLSGKTAFKPLLAVMVVVVVTVISYEALTVCPALTSSYL